MRVNQPKKFKQFGGYVFEKILTHTTIGASTVMMHKDLFEEVGFFDERLEVCEDFDLWLRIAKKNFLGFLEERLTLKYGGHSDQLSTKHWGMDRFRLRALNKHKENRAVQEIVKQKSEVLLKGAIKHANVELQRECEWYLNQKF